VSDHSVRGILLDIEGTTSSVSFVYDVMFPLVRSELDGYLQTHQGEEELTGACEQIAKDAGHDSLADWASAADQEPLALVRDEVVRLMDNDVKATGLKQLQGLIWRDSFQSGDLKAHVYEDTPLALARWREAGLDVRIYSSGSITAQKLFFGHTIVGDLLPLLNGHYDTTTGPKKEASSYQTIAAAFDLPPERILFFSDVVAELNAAQQAGLQTTLVKRPGNAPVEEHDHEVIEKFDEAKISSSV